MSHSCFWKRELVQKFLQRIPYRVVLKELDVPAFRKIGFVMRDKKTASLAVKKFMEYLDYRNIEMGLH